MVHIFNNLTIAHTLLYACLTFFITPYILVQKTNLINMTYVSDPCQSAFVIGFILSLLLWNIFTKKNVY